MHIISYQSLAGGTGVTSVAAEAVRNLIDMGERVLAIDLGPNRMLGEVIGNKAIPVLDAVHTLFATDNPVPFTLPAALLLHDVEHGVENRLREQHMFGPQGFTTPAIAFARLERQLVAFAEHFDFCIVDLSKGHQHLMKMFVELSDEVHFFERECPPNLNFASFKAQFLSKRTSDREQQLYKQADRGHLAIPMS